MKPLETYLCEIQREPKFEIFRDLILFYNKKFNLTSITDEREILVKHFLDSAAGESLIPKGAHVSDVGAGAGFPSLALKILRDDLSFVLLESVTKKCEFLKTAIRELQLSRTEVLPLRAEDAGRDPRFRESFDCCVARAVARLDTLSEYCLPLIKCGGKFLAYKGSADERQCAERAVLLLGGTFSETLCFSLPDGMGERTIFSIRKIKKTPAKYPRGQGKERRNPIQ